MGAKVTREVSICLVGVGHDDVEYRFRKRFRRARKPNELVFWEYMFRKDSEDKHHGYEDYIANSIEFVHTALGIRILQDTRFFMRHGKFEPSTMATDPFLFEYKPQNFEIYKKYTLEEKMIVRLFQYFWKGLCENQGQDSIFTTLLSKNEEVVEQWQTMIKKVDNKTKRNNCWIIIAHDTLSIVNTFLDEFTRLLIDNRKDIPDMLRNTANILHEMTNGDPQDWRDDWHLANVKIRDQLSLRYIQNLLEKNQNIDSVILITGSAHIRSLHQYIEEYNVLMNRSDKTGIIYYNNIMEIIPTYLRGNNEFYPLPNNVTGVGPQKNSMSSDVIDAYVKDIMTRITGWRSAIRIKPIGFEEESSSEDSSSDDEEEVKTTKTKRPDKDKKVTKKTRYKSMCLSCYSQALVQELGNPEHTFCDAVCQEKFYFLQ
jgi:hypothetical protein